MKNGRMRHIVVTLKPANAPGNPDGKEHDPTVMERTSAADEA